MTNKTSRAVWITVIMAAWCAAAMAQAPSSGSLNGQVKDSAGKPQMGVLVEVFNATVAKPIAVFTDAKGFYTAA